MVSLMPIILSAWLTEMEHPHRCIDRNFGFGLDTDQLTQPNNYCWSRNRSPLDVNWRSWTDIHRRADSGPSTVTTDEDTFKVILDVQQFKPDEINVKVVDRFIIVEAKHEEKRDEHGYISRQFSRRYMVPEEADIDQVASNISSDGILSITAPLKKLPENQNEKVITITQTGKPALKIKDKEKPKPTVETPAKDTTQDNAEENTIDASK